MENFTFSIIKVYIGYIQQYTYGKYHVSELIRVTCGGSKTIFMTDQHKVYCFDISDDFPNKIITYICCDSYYI